MKTQFPDFNTPAGIRAVADKLENMAEQAELFPPEPQAPRISLGHLRLNPDAHSLKTTAAMLRKAAPEAGKPRSGAWVKPEPSFTAPWDREKPDVLKLDAVRVCGTPEAAAATIRRQLDMQGESMDPADKKRAEKALAQIETHLWRLAEKERSEATGAAMLDRIYDARRPAREEVLPDGTEIVSGRYLGTITGSKTAKNGAVSHSAAFTLELDRRNGSTSRVKPKTYKALRHDEFTILPAPTP
jgi:hypothetical protein